MKNILIALISLFAVENIAAQTVLLEKDINQSVYLKKKGPNKKHFFHLYFDVEPYFGKGEAGFQSSDFLSCRDAVGIRNYFRLTERYIMGFDVEFGSEVFRIEQNAQKTFPSVDQHKKEQLYSYVLGATYFNRFLITRRENSLGTWVDLGGYAYYTCGTRHFMRDNAPAAYDGNLQEVTIKGLNYVERLNYGVRAKLGYKRYALVASYRLSDWIKKSKIKAEPTRFSIGIELGLY